jgi:hypothetical protein
MVGKTNRRLPALHLTTRHLTKPAQETPTAAHERLKALQSLPLPDITPEVAGLALSILASGKVPRKAATEAAHIAIAAVHGIDFLVTWNCVHIANAAIAMALASICRKPGFECEAVKYRFDVKAILAAAKRRQRHSGHKVVSFVSKKELSA